jgi:hypothetical protein
VVQQQQQHSVMSAWQALCVALLTTSPWAHPQQQPLPSCFLPPGNVGIDEMITAYAMVGIHLTKAAALELVAEVDADGSGEIEFDEFRRVTQQIVISKRSCGRDRQGGCSWLGPRTVHSRRSLPLHAAVPYSLQRKPPCFVTGR